MFINGFSCQLSGESRHNAIGRKGRIYGQRVFGSDNTKLSKMAP
jgi:hypothetical protein